MEQIRRKNGALLRAGGMAAICALAFLAFLAPASARADAITYYRDENGGMHYVKVPSNASGNIVLKRPVMGADAPTPWRGSRFLNFFGVLNSPADREKIMGLARKYSRQYGVDPKLTIAVIEVESGYDPAVVSSKGAQGLMQIMPGTGSELGLTRPFEPEDNVRAGVRYLKEQLDRFKSVELALAAYNAGPAAVERYGGVPPFEETRNYVRKVLARMN